MAEVVPYDAVNSANFDPQGVTRLHVVGLEGVDLSSEVGVSASRLGFFDSLWPLVRSMYYEPRPSIARTARVIAKLIANGQPPEQKAIIARRSSRLVGDGDVLDRWAGWAQVADVVAVCHMRAAQTLVGVALRRKHDGRDGLSEEIARDYQAWLAAQNRESAVLTVDLATPVRNLYRGPI